MGVIAELIKTTLVAIKKWHAAPGQAVVIIGKGLGGVPAETEMAHPPGIFSSPPKGFQAVFLPIGRGRRYGLAICGLNYKLSINLNPGETTIYSTDSSGTLKARIDLDASGNIKLNGNTKRLVTYSELNTALQAFKTALNAALATKLDGGGNAGALTLDISAAETQTVRTGG